MESKLWTDKRNGSIVTSFNILDIEHMEALQCASCASHALVRDGDAVVCKDCNAQLLDDMWYCGCGSGTFDESKGEVCCGDCK